MLGPVEARRAGVTISLGGPKQRALLAIFLLHANEVASRDRLIDGLWGERAPASASHTLDDYVSRLRKALGKERLMRKPPGYVLRVERGEFDLDRFRELIEAGEPALAKGRIDEAAASFHKALSLWRGPPLANVSGEGFLLAEADRLEELRLSTLEQRVESDLALGRHGRLVGELESLVRAHPLRERFRAQLMLALYRAGRQADALAAYAETRALLVEQLGLEPGAQLRQLQQRILAQDPDLQLRAGGAPIVGPPPSRAKRRTSRRRAVLLVGAAAVVSVAVVLVMVLAVGGGSHRRLAAAGSIALLDTGSGAVRTDLSAASGTGLVRTGEGWIWDRKDSGILAQIDPRTLRLGHTFSLERTIGGFAAGEGALWFVASDSRTLLRVDPRYGVVTRRIPLSPETDPKLGAIGESADVALGAGSVWVAHGLAQVDRVDPASGRLLHRFPIRDASLVASGGGTIWVASSDLGTLTKIDPATDTIVASARIRPWICCLAVGGDSVWASNSERIWKLSPDGELLDTIKTASETGDISFGDEALWVTDDVLGAVTRVDARTDATRDVHLGHLVTGIAASGNLVAVDVAPTDLDLISALKGRVLQVRFSQDWIDDPDPAVGGEPGSNEWPWLQQLLYATTARLLTYRDAPAPAGWQLVPEIAASLPSVSPDGRTYTFRIRRGFRFSPPSNQAVTARTFRYSIERALSPELGQNAPAVAVASDIAGVAAYRAGHAAHISGIRARDDTLTITLQRPAPDFPERMALSYFAPVPLGTPAVLNGLRDPIPSAGPYYISVNDGGVVAILRRNPNYHGSRPHGLDAVVFRGQPDVSQAVTAITAGKADYIAEPGAPMSSGQLARTYGAPTGGQQRYFQSRLLGVDELAFDTTNGPFTDPRLRRAVNFALDRPAIAATLGDEVTDRYVPLGIPGYQPRHVYPLVGPDLDRARALAGSVARHVTLDVCAQPACLEAGHIVAADLARIGIRTFVRQYNGDLAQTLARPGADIVLARVFAPYPDPVVALRIAVGRRLGSRLDRLAQLDRPGRLAAAERLEVNLLRNEAPAAAIGTPTIPELFSARVGCMTFQPLFFGVDLSSLCLHGD